MITLHFRRVVATPKDIVLLGYMLSVFNALGRQQIRKTNKKVEGIRIIIRIRLRKRSTTCVSLFLSRLWDIVHLRQGLGTILRNFKESHVLSKIIFLENLLNFFPNKYFNLFKLYKNF